MAARRHSTGNIPLVRRIRRHSSFSTLFRAYDDTPEVKALSSEVAASRPIKDLANNSIPKATLIPGGSSLPVGLIVPPAGIEPPLASRPSYPSSVHRNTIAPDTSPDQPPEGPAVSKTTPIEPTASIVPDAPSVERESESSISEAEWAHLQAVMRGHKEKLAREQLKPKSPEQIQREAEAAEQEVAKQQAEAETKRRQELARSGKLPKAQVVYLSPDQPAAIAAKPLDTPEVRPIDQERDEVVAEDLLIEDQPDIGIEAGEELQEADVVEKPAMFEASEPRRLESVEATNELQLAPDEQAPEERIPEPKAEPENERTTTDQSPVPADTDPAQELVASTLQLESEPAAESAPLQEPAVRSEPDLKVDPVEKEGLGQRLLDAARSVFRRREATPSSPEPAVLLSVEKELSPEIEEEKTIDLAAAGEPEIAEEYQPTEGQTEQVDEKSLTQDGAVAPSAERSSIQAAQPVVQRSSEKSGSSAPDKSAAQMLGAQKPSHDSPSWGEPDADLLESLEDPGDFSEPEVERVAEATLAEPAVVEPSSEIPKEPAVEAQVMTEFESESSLSEPEASAPMERSELLPKTSGDQFWIQEEPPSDETEAAEIQLEPETSRSKPAATEQDSEAKVEGREETKPPAEEAAGQLELPPDPGKVEGVDKPQTSPSMDSEEVETGQQALPLEQVWPVQQVELAPREPVSEPAIQDSIADQRDESGELPTLIVQREISEELSNETELRSALSKVSPGKPTDSSVELVAPRRPRPSVIPVQTRPEDPGSSEPTSQTIQRHPEDSEPIETRPKLGLADGGEVRRITQPEPRPLKPATVKTEIGDLPGDLWQYLGEEPPSSIETQSTVEGSHVATEVATIQRSDLVASAPAQVLEYSPPTKTIGLDAVLPWIQRTDSGEQTESGGGESETEVTGEDEEDEAEDVDIEKLARDILPLIKRKLAIEWERNRGRF
jgi:hypothetical protein